MSNEVTSDASADYERLFGEACRLSEGEILIHGRSLGPPNGQALRRLERAIACFEAALAVQPDAWPAAWMLGKIHQRLGNTSAALAAFSRAHALNPTQPDVAREAGLAALDAGDGPAAVRFCQAAVAANPEDPGLLSNLALAFLISGEVGWAQQAVQRALARSPEDHINRAVAEMVDDVACGRRPQPSRVPTSAAVEGAAGSREVPRWLWLIGGSLMWGLVGAATLCLFAGLKALVLILMQLLGGRTVPWVELLSLAGWLFGVGFACGVLGFIIGSSVRRLGPIGDALAGAVTGTFFFLCCMRRFDPDMLTAKTGDGWTMLVVGAAVGAFLGASVGNELRPKPDPTL